MAAKMITSHKKGNFRLDLYVNHSRSKPSAYFYRVFDLKTLNHVATMYDLALAETMSEKL
jgi:hypothetical protein